MSKQKNPNKHRKENAAEITIITSKHVEVVS